MEEGLELRQIAAKRRRRVLALNWTKSDVRSSALAKRASVAGALRLGIAARLAAEGPGLALSCIDAPTVALFRPMRGEPDTGPLMGALAAAGHQTCLPVTQARGQPLLFRAWRPGDPLVAGPWGLEEPASSLPLCVPNVLFVPLAAFDRRGHRIGYGAGHYDRTLAALRAGGPVYAIGVAFAAQEVALVPAEAHDEALDFVLTERETIRCGPP